MSTLRELPKMCSFVAALVPDDQIQTPEAAAENADNVIRTPRILQDGSFSYSYPEHRKRYMYLTSSPQALADLGLDPLEPESAEYRLIVCGEIYNQTGHGLPVPYAQAYAGWQFGQFAGQLGDGRVHNLFEVLKPHCQTLPSHGQNRDTYEVQLKGLGMTPYSRFADGKAVLRLSLREYVISEHLNAVGIPLTRALALTYLPETYARRHGAEKCAIVTRFAELWIRLGSFDLHRWRHDVAGVRRLCRYTIDELFTMKSGEQFPAFSKLYAQHPDVLGEAGRSVGPLTEYDRMYYEIIVRNATTTAMWQAYGFLNGVLNTDNTLVLGLLMDFGPFAIMDRLDRKFTPNSEDHMLRYSYSNTPTAIWWNLTRLGEDLAHLIGAGENMIEDEALLRGAYSKSDEERIVKRATKIIEAGAAIYQHAFTKKYAELLFQRLGLNPLLVDPQDPDTQNKDLLAPMLDMLENVQCDFNKFFLALEDADVASARFDPENFARSLLVSAPADPLTYDAEALVPQIKEWLIKYRTYAIKHGTDWASSSRVNPRFLPRSWILNEVIQKTEESGGLDLKYLHKLEKMAFNPYDSSKWGPELKDVEARWVVQGDVGEDMAMLQCSCSS